MLLIKELPLSLEGLNACVALAQRHLRYGGIHATCAGKCIKAVQRDMVPAGDGGRPPTALGRHYPLFPVTTTDGEPLMLERRDCDEYKRWKAAQEGGASGAEGAVADLTLKDKDGNEIEKQLPGGKVKKKSKPQVRLDLCVQQRHSGLDICVASLGAVELCPPHAGWHAACFECGGCCLGPDAQHSVDNHKLHFNFHGHDRSSSTRTHGTSGSALQRYSAWTASA